MKKFKYTIAQRLEWMYLDTKRTIQRLYNRAVVAINGGYSCDCCGAKLPIDWTELEGKVDGKSMMLMQCSDSLYCKTCVAEKLEIFFDHAELENVPCSWKPEETKTAGVIGPLFGSLENSRLAERLDLNVRFGSNWWNGHHVSKKAALQFLMSDDTKYRTSIIAYKNSKMVFVDRNGVTIDYE